MDFLLFEMWVFNNLHIVKGVCVWQHADGWGCFAGERGVGVRGCVRTIIFLAYCSFLHSLQFDM